MRDGDETSDLSSACGGAPRSVLGSGLPGGGVACGGVLGGGLAGGVSLAAAGAGTAVPS